MSAAPILKSLKAVADKKILAAWKAQGHSSSDTVLGVSHPSLKEVAKKHKKDATSLDELWASGVHEARLLAVMLEDPKKITSDKIRARMADVKSADLADAWADFVATTPFLDQFLAMWCDGDSEMAKRCGFRLLIAKLMNDKRNPDGYYEKYLKQVEEELSDDGPWARESMLNAFIAIGTRNPSLNRKAVEIAKRLPILPGPNLSEAPNPLTVLTDPKIVFRSR